MELSMVEFDGVLERQFVFDVLECETDGGGSNSTGWTELIDNFLDRVGEV